MAALPVPGGHPTRQQVRLGGPSKVTNNTGEVVHWVVEVGETLERYVYASSGDRPYWDCATPERALGPGEFEWVDVKVEVSADHK